MGVACWLATLWIAAGPRRGRLDATAREGWVPQRRRGHLDDARSCGEKDAVTESAVALHTWLDVRVGYPIDKRT